MAGALRDMPRNHAGPIAGLVLAVLLFGARPAGAIAFPCSDSGLEFPDDGAFFNSIGLGLSTSGDFLVGTANNRALIWDATGQRRSLATPPGFAPASEAVHAFDAAETASGELVVVGLWSNGALPGSTLLRWVGGFPPALETTDLQIAGSTTGTPAWSTTSRSSPSA